MDDRKPDKSEDAKAYRQLLKRANDCGFPTVNDALDELDELVRSLGVASKE